jgi:hypothetical protein
MKKNYYTDEYIRQLILNIEYLNQNIEKIVRLRDVCVYSFEREYYKEIHKNMCLLKGHYVSIVQRCIDNI